MSRLVPFVVRLDPDTLQELEARAEAEDRTKTEVARRLIETGLENAPEQVLVV